jgi:hypothetical protein
MRISRIFPQNLNGNAPAPDLERRTNFPFGGRSRYNIDSDSS